MRLWLLAAAFVQLFACDPTYQPQAGLWVVRDVTRIADTCGGGLEVTPPDAVTIVRDKSKIRLRRTDGLFVDCDRTPIGFQRYACDELDVHVRLEDIDVVIREQAELYVLFDGFSEGRFLLQTGVGCQAGPCEEESEALEEIVGAPVPCGISWEGSLTFDYEQPDPNNVR